MIEYNEEFIAIGADYDEKPWRNIIKTRFSSEEARDLAGTQTKPFFALLSRLIQYANDMSPLNEEVMPLDFPRLTNTIALLEKELAPIEGAPSLSVSPPQANADLPRNVLYFGAPFAQAKAIMPNIMLNIKLNTFIALFSLLIIRILIL